MIPSLRSALGPSGRPFGDGLRSAAASWAGAPPVAAINTKQGAAGSTLKSPIRGRRLGVGAPAVMVAFERDALISKGPVSID